MKNSLICVSLILLAFAMPARSAIIYNEAPSLDLFSDLQAFLGELPDNAEPARVQRVLTYNTIGTDFNKDGFVDSQLQSEANPIGYVVLHSHSLWGNVRIILGQPYRYTYKTALDGNDDGSTSASPVSRQTIRTVPEPASLVTLLVGSLVFSSVGRLRKARCKV